MRYLNLNFAIVGLLQLLQIAQAAPARLCVEVINSTVSTATVSNSAENWFVSNSGSGFLAKGFQGVFYNPQTKAELRIPHGWITPPHGKVRNGFSRVNHIESGTINFVRIADGSLLLPPESAYESAIDFNEGFAVVKRKEAAKDLPASAYQSSRQYDIVNAAGKITPIERLLYSMSDPFSEGYAVALDMFGVPQFVNTIGQIKKIPPFISKNNPTEKFRIVSALGFHEGLALIGVAAESEPPHSRNIKYGYINRDFNFVIEPQSEDSSSFKNGVASAKINGKYGVINTKGEWILTPRFSQISHGDRSEFVIGRIDRELVVINMKTKEIQKLPERNVDDHYFFISEGVVSLPVSVNRQPYQRYYDLRKGDWLNSNLYTSISPFQRGYSVAVVNASTNMVGREVEIFVDRAGNELRAYGVSMGESLLSGSELAQRLLENRP